MSALPQFSASNSSKASSSSRVSINDTGFGFVAVAAAEAAASAFGSCFDSSLVPMIVSRVIYLWSCVAFGSGCGFGASVTFCAKSKWDTSGSFTNAEEGDKEGEMRRRMFSSVTSTMEDRMASALQNRRVKGNLRSLRPLPSDVDFSSNDYLGLASDPNQVLAVGRALKVMERHGKLPLGATGSRLLSGDYDFTHDLEKELAKIHGAKAALLFNSGYDANLSVISCLACDIVIYDELIHNSLHMGIRLWLSARKDRKAIPFRHNDLDHLRSILDEHRKECATVLIESVYSMDGDKGPVYEALDLASEYGAKVVCDEAHGLGVLSATGALADCTHPALGFCVYTYGKAAGAHGAMVCCPSEIARDYLINYAYPLIYSTALPPHSLAVIRAAYQTMASVRGSKLRTTLNALIDEFKNAMLPVLQKYKDIYLLPSETPIQALIVPGNVLCSKLCHLIYAKSNIRLFPIRAPTVSLERVRIVLHANNTVDQVKRLVVLLEEALRELYVTPTVAKL